MPATLSRRERQVLKSQPTGEMEQKQNWHRDKHMSLVQRPHRKERWLPAHGMLRLQVPVVLDVRSLRVSLLSLDVDWRRRNWALLRTNQLIRLPRR